MNKPIIQLVDICKEYYGNQVLKKVNVSVRPGEVHALVGENGAGKSTLMNILLVWLLFAQVVFRTSFFDGEKVDITSPKEAMDKGIGMVHQEFMLLPGFTITENIKLNREITKHNVISKILGEKMKSLDMESMRKDARKALDTLGLDIYEMLSVEGLPVGHKQFIEIAREIDKTNVRLLVFDEPTAVLTEIEAELFLKAVKKLASTGIAILFITYRLNEVMCSRQYNHIERR